MSNSGLRLLQHLFFPSPCMSHIYSAFFLIPKMFFPFCSPVGYQEFVLSCCTDTVHCHPILLYRYGTTVIPFCWTYWYGTVHSTRSSYSVGPIRFGTLLSDAVVSVWYGTLSSIFKSFVHTRPFCSTPLFSSRVIYNTLFFLSQIDFILNILLISVLY